MSPLERILEILGLSGHAVAYTSGVVTAVSLLIVGLLVLPRGRRPALRMPALAFVAHFALLGIRTLLEDGDPAAHAIGLLALFLLLISLARSTVLVAFHAVAAGRVGKPWPKIFTDIVQGGSYAIALFVTLSAAGVAMDSLLTTSALLTAVIGLSLQDTLGNLFAGLAIQVQHPFEVGDWIEFDGEDANAGMVIEINWRAARVLTLDQVEVIVPNNQLARSPIRNFTKPLPESRRKIFAYAPYAIPPRRVARHVLRAIKDVPGVLENPAATVIPYEFDERGVKYQVRYFIRDFMERENIDAAVRERVWYALSRAGIPIPVPQRFIELHEGTKEEEQETVQRQVREREAHLKRLSFLKGLPNDALQALAERSQTRLYDAREAIIRQGDEENELFIVVRGRVRVVVSKANGDETQEVARLGPGDFFGEMSLMTGEARTATVRAVDECELVAVGKDALHHVFDLHPEFMARVSEKLANREKQLDALRKNHEPSTETSPDRSAEILDRIRDFFSM